MIFKCARCVMHGCSPKYRRVAHPSTVIGEPDYQPLDAVTIWGGEALCLNDFEEALREHYNWMKKAQQLGFKA